MTLSEEKQVLRNEARARRVALKADAPDAAQRIVESFFASISLSKDAVVAGYIAVRDEMDPAFLISALRKRECQIALPRVVAKDGPLAFHLWQENASPVKGAYGLMEAAPDWLLIRPEIVLVPLLAFDAEGFRLGYGGGYYDRSLSALRETGSVLAVGVAYDGQEITKVPRDITDQRLDWVVTEKGARKFG